MTTQLVKQIPDISNNYVLEPDSVTSFWSVVVPDPATNLIPNPSFELGTSGWSIQGANTARTSDQSSAGLYSLYIESPSGGGGYGQCVENLSLTGGQPYYFSAAVRASVPGTAIRLYAYNAGENYYNDHEFIVEESGWVRIGKQFAPPSDMSVNLAIIVQYQDPGFWVDAVMLTEGGDAHTYFDGDSKTEYGTFRYPPYGWNGEPHASTSYRQLTRQGGKLVSFNKAGFQTMGFSGFGLATPTIVETTEGVTGKTDYLDSTATNRDVTITGVIFGNTLQELIQRRDVLMSLFNPYDEFTGEPILLRFQLYVGADKVGPEIEFKAVYLSGLEGNLDNWHQERIALRFRLYDTFPYSESDHTANLALQDTFTARGILVKDTDGDWSDMQDSSTPAVDNLVTMIDFNANGTMYTAGWFTWINGVQASRFAWRLADGTWVGCDPSYAPSSNVFAVSALQGVRNHQVAIAGMFAVDGSLRDRRRIMVYDTFADIAYEPFNKGLNDVARRLLALPNGDFIVGGDFTADGVDGQPLGRIAGFNAGDLWDDFGGGFSSADARTTVLALERDVQGNIYAAGFLPDHGHIAMWDGTSWTALGGGFNDQVNTMKFGPDGYLYAGGVFTADVNGVVEYEKIARWNGFSWERMNLEVDRVLDIGFDRRGVGYINGDTIGGYINDHFIRFRGTNFFPADIDFADPAPHSITFAEHQPPGWGMAVSQIGYAVWTSKTTVVQYEGAAPDRPIFQFSGPGTLRTITNETTGAAVHFQSNFVVEENEIVTVDLSKAAIEVYSNLRPNLLSFLLPSSINRFALVPGENKISVFVSGDITADSTLVMRYKVRYLGLSDTVRI